MKLGLFGEEPVQPPGQKDPATSQQAQPDEAFLEKYKHKSAIGSEDLDFGGFGGKKDLSQFEGRSAIGSDDVFGKNKAASTASSFE